MIGAMPAPSWLTTDWLLSQFGQGRNVARLHYVDFVRAGVGQAPIREGLRQQWFLGSERFVQDTIRRRRGCTEFCV